MSLAVLPLERRGFLISSRIIGGIERSWVVSVTPVLFYRSGLELFNNDCESDMLQNAACPFDPSVVRGLA